MSLVIVFLKFAGLWAMRTNCYLIMTFSVPVITPLGRSVELMVHKAYTYIGSSKISRSMG